MTPSSAPPAVPTEGGVYVGRRRAAVADHAPAVAPASYVGRRRAAAAAGDPHDNLHDEPLARPLPTRIVLREQPETRGPVESPENRIGDELVQDARITTAEIEAIVDAALHDTAPRPRIRVDEAVPAFTVPEPRHDQIARPADDDTRPVPRAERAVRDVSAQSDTRTDSLVDLPRISVAATYAADLSGDTTTLLPAVNDGGRRRARTSRVTTRRRRPSMPLIAGVAATLAAVGGVVLTAHPGMTTAVDTQLSGASALTGTTAVASVGGVGSSSRLAVVSRDDNRTAADDAAKARARALGDLDADAAGQQKYLNSNRWGLPIEAGDYHLTGRFGDVSGLWATIHTGLDFAAPTGTPIHAVARGTITATGWGGAYGNRTIETLPDGTEIWYCHQSQFGTTVGATVETGQVMGYVGATGNVTGPHVHIEVRPGGGDPVDPDPAFKAHGVDPDANQ